MADASTRRSVRSRTTQPTTSSHHSSASSNSSQRADRNTRTSTKIESPRKSTPSGSLSSEPVDETVAHTIEGLQTRRSRKRGQTEDEEMAGTKGDDVLNGDDGEGEEDDGTVRCICGLADYPGPPLWTEDDKKQFGDMEFITAEDVTEDLAGFFLSCDNCKVWQHGGCVGIKNEDVSPDEYYCEECRRDLHRVFTATDGQKYSLYLPLQPNFSPSTSRAASFSKDGDKSERGRNARATSAQQNAKRRSTMNSRDAAYDEEEQLRRAIEASRGGKVEESIDGGTRRGKRGRSDSEEKPEGSKRQRTASRSTSPARDVPTFESQLESDEDSKGRNGGSKKIRGAAAKNHSAKEAREEKERLRLEAANKRKGRAERRRVDDESEPPEEAPPIRPPTKSEPPATTPIDPPPSAAPPQPDTPPTAPVVQSTSQHKKGGRPPQTKKGKSGKNQYTKDGDEDSPGRSTSRDPHKDEPETRKEGKDSHKKKVNGVSNSGVMKVSWIEMRRRVATMLDYIAKVQVEMADQTSIFGGSVGGNANGEEAAKGLMKGLAGSIVPMLKEQGVNGAVSVGENGMVTEDGKNGELEKSFDDMTLLEMMEFLTRRLIMWQQQFGT